MPTDGVRLVPLGEQVYQVHAPVGTVAATAGGWTARAADGQTFTAPARDLAVETLVLYAVRRPRDVAAGPDILRAEVPAHHNPEETSR